MDHPRILIVEDHPTMRGAMRLVLEEGGYRIDEASDGVEALRIVREDPPDLMFLDLHMPGMSGSEILGAIRAEPGAAATRVIVVTADGEEGREKTLALRGGRVLHEAVQPGRAPQDSGAGVEATCRGSVTRNRDPAPVVDATSTRPPMAVASRRVMARPSPAPSTSRRASPR